MENAQNSGTTNNTPDSLVLVVATAENTTWVTPPDNAEFTLNADATIPEIVFEFNTEAAGPYQWSWDISWNAKQSGLRESARGKTVLRTYSDAGEFSSIEKKWAVNFGEGKILGGDLVVSVEIGELTIKRSIKIKGQNPVVTDLHAFIDSLENSSGLEKLLAHESYNKHFINRDGEPVVSFDQGYGMAQMTNPAPDYTTTWSWKENVKAGRDLFQTKREQAIRHLSQHGTYTNEMVEREAIALWNGGYYYRWDDTTSVWVRKYNHLCDTTTGNIGWNMNNPTNAGQTEVQLHNRDQPTYASGSSGQSAEHAWVYSGLCYADKVYGK
ncbi:hypothetical protein [Pantoea coffeiphila]|uniref:Uncharacterized protein n=1 Tax=Pantoea coffeiphila TaxID=1465635 RepID=A0A2S9IFS9_9GAMM|nr:hypothetical protein [Pantoea coffeiphila]PRD16594.1 hypothetical protein CQW29_02705 [Pantoea coffeiphila]